MASAAVPISPMSLDNLCEIQEWAMEIVEDLVYLPADLQGISKIILPPDGDITLSKEKSSAGNELRLVSFNINEEYL